MNRPQFIITELNLRPRSSILKPPRNANFTCPSRTVAFSSIELIRLESICNVTARREERKTFSPDRKLSWGLITNSLEGKKPVLRAEFLTRSDIIKSQRKIKKYLFSAEAIFSSANVASWRNLYGLYFFIRGRIYGFVFFF